MTDDEVNEVHEAVIEYTDKHIVYHHDDHEDGLPLHITRATMDLPNGAQVVVDCIEPVHMWDYAYSTQKCIYRYHMMARCIQDSSRRWQIIEHQKQTKKTPPWATALQTMFVAGWVAWMGFVLMSVVRVLKVTK